MTRLNPALPEGVTLYHALLPNTEPERHGTLVSALSRIYGDRVKALLELSTEEITRLLNDPSPDNVVVADVPMLLHTQENPSDKNFAGITPDTRLRIDLLIAFLGEEETVPPNQGPFVVSTSGYAYSPYLMFLADATESGRVIGVHDFPFHGGTEFKLPDFAIDEMGAQGHSFSYVQLAREIIYDLDERSKPIDQRWVNRKRTPLVDEDDDYWDDD